MNAPATEAPLVEPRILVREWRAGIRIIHIAHTRAAADYSFRERLLGLSVTIIAAISGTAVFGAAATSSDKTILFIAGAFTIFAAVVAAAHTFLGLGALASEHAAAAKEYGVLRKEFEAKLACPDATNLCALLEEIRRRWNEIEAKYRFVSQKRYSEAQRAIARPAQSGSAAEPAPAPAPAAEQPA
jgi:hypothetical protein